MIRKLRLDEGLIPSTSTGFANPAAGSHIGWYTTAMNVGITTGSNLLGVIDFDSEWSRIHRERSGQSNGKVVEMFPTRLRAVA